MNRTVIDERIHAAIRPQLDRCDRLLDHYLQDAPAEVWEPIAAKFRPKTPMDRLRDSMGKMSAALQAIGDGFNAMVASIQKPLTRGDLTEAR